MRLTQDQLRRQAQQREDRIAKLQQLVAELKRREELEQLIAPFQAELSHLQ